MIYIPMNIYIYIMMHIIYGLGACTIRNWIAVLDPRLLQHTPTKRPLDQQLLLPHGDLDAR